MALPSNQLRDLVSRIEIVEDFDYNVVRQDIATLLGISPDVERDAVLTELLGWVSNCSKPRGVLALQE